MLTASRNAVNPGHAIQLDHIGPAESAFSEISGQDDRAMYCSGLAIAAAPRTPLQQPHSKG
jgi:hypothetical protein